VPDEDDGTRSGVDRAEDVVEVGVVRSMHGVPELAEPGDHALPAPRAVPGGMEKYEYVHITHYKCAICTY
jgi:hypothetical protein